MLCGCHMFARALPFHVDAWVWILILLTAGVSPLKPVGLVVVMEQDPAVLGGVRTEPKASRTPSFPVALVRPDLDLVRKNPPSVKTPLKGTGTRCHKAKGLTEAVM
ncbi:hypothetical protein KIL84_008783 [Mauremys mutica]|uniref:Uncharacterized protein n=1 Tax=Mauremys mutica TaxID=74926 RepID=A0A9D4ASR0_9SAUR|nr:hypothetical protein KIL84_008783 [Mauremys mutica]